MQQKRTLVCGAGGFIGGHLCALLKSLGHYVVGVDRKLHEFAAPPCDEFYQLDLMEPANAQRVVCGMDEVYQLAAEMGGMGYIHSASRDIMHNSVLVNANMLRAASDAGVKRYFFSSSVCVYPNMKHGDPPVNEDFAYPAMPDNDYGWEKLFSERMALSHTDMMEVRIARFQNCYGPMGTWRGGREKAPAAFCRKVAESTGEVEMWGDGTAVRSFIYVDDLCRGIYALMQSDERRPTNIGTEERVTVRELLSTVASVAGKEIVIKSIPGPVGVEDRNFIHDRIRAIGWKPEYTLRDGIARTYPWIAEQVAA
jgi:GDP-D-mannose 3',5'-epimerase